LSRITHGDRVVYPETGTTKRNVAEYYLKVADRILPHLQDRPVSFVRAPEGLGHETFFQRHPLPGMKRGIGRVPDPAKSNEDYLVINDVEGLITAAQFGVIEMHGWGARASDLEHMDRAVFDLDPDEAVPFPRVRDAALQLRDLLSGIGLQSFPMATGGKGIHVIVPLDASQNWDMVGDFTAGLAKGLAAADPENFVGVMSKARRKGKIYIDWVRNRRSATAILPYSLRARPKPTIAMPLSWDDLKTLKSAAAFQYGGALSEDEAWPGFFKIRQNIPSSALDYVKRNLM
jgi:bifunctional non-homologous end joining protein LigD